MMSSNKKTEIDAQWKTCKVCGKYYPHFSAKMSLQEFREMAYDDEVDVNLPSPWPKGALSWSDSLVSNTENCGRCYDKLIREEILIRVKQERDFRKIPNMEKASMFATGQLPDDICWFCGVKIDVGPSHSPKNIYACKKCRAEGLGIDDVNKGIVREK